MPNEFTLVSTSRESPEYIAPVCYCLWHPRILPGSPVPNDLRLVSTLPCTLHRSATVFDTLADFQDQRCQTTRLLSTSRDPPVYIATVCYCLWHPRRLPGFQVPNEFTLVSTSRESPEYIEPVCYCLWHPRRLPGSTLPNDLRLVSTSRDPPEYIASVCDCFWHPRRLPGSTVPNMNTIWWNILWYHHRLPRSLVPNDV